MQRAETLRVRSGVVDGQLGLLEAMRAATFTSLVDVNLRVGAD